jgi:hypothetical protein
LIIFTHQLLNRGSSLKSGRHARDPIKSDSELVTKVIVPVHPSFSCRHYLPDKPMIYSDSSPLLSQEIFTSIFCAPINNVSKTTKTAIPPKPRFLSVSSNLPQTDFLVNSSAGPEFDRLDPRSNQASALELGPHSRSISARTLFPQLLPCHCVGSRH